MDRFAGLLQVATGRILASRLRVLTL